MKIVHIVAGNEEGGLEKHVVELCNALSDRYKIHVIAHKKYASRFCPKVAFHPLDLSKGRRNLYVLFRLAGLLRKLAPDIVHAHANKAVWLVSKTMWILPKHTKTIATLHSQKRSLKAYEKFDRVIGVSKRILKHFRKKEKSLVIYNGIVLSKIAYSEKTIVPIQSSLNDIKCVLCAVGRLVKVKNFEMLIHAVAPLHHVGVMIAGEGTERSYLEALIRRLGIEHRVRLVGHIDDVLDWMKTCDACVISSDKEGLSYVLIEALLLKKPVISTDVSDVASILPHDFVVSIGDVAAMQKAIKRFCGLNQEEREKKFAQSFAFAQEHFRFDQMISRIESVYKELVS